MHTTTTVPPGAWPVDEYTAMDEAALNQEPREPFIMHYVRFNKNLSQPVPLSFLDCLSVLSAQKRLKPDLIFLHSDRADSWPFDACQGIITDYSRVKIVQARRNETIFGKKPGWISHEVDIYKLELLRDLGGVTMDFDAYFINATVLRQVYYRNATLQCAMMQAVAGKGNVVAGLIVTAPVGL